MANRYYCHLGYMGINSWGELHEEPPVRSPLLVAGYGHTMDAAYTAARRALLARHRQKEVLVKESKVEKFLKALAAKQENPKEQDERDTEEAGQDVERIGG